MSRKPNRTSRSRRTPSAAPRRRVPGPAGAARHKPDIRIDKAQAAWAQRRYDLAISYYEQALARDPLNSVLLVDVARAYALRFRYADAEQLVARAERLYPSDAPLQAMLGRSYVQLQQFDRAIACFRRSLELAPQAPDRPAILLALAKMYERLHDLEAAEACAQEALALAPGYEKARYVLATIDRRAGRVETAEARWREMIDARRAPPGVLADAWYELAALHDAAGRYAEAFDALTQAKRILSHAASPQRDEAATIAHHQRQTFADITAQHCQRWQATRDTLPSLGAGLALLTSHPRSGTTLLEQVLDGHPGLISADELQIMPELVHVPLGQQAPAGASVIQTLDQASGQLLQQLRQHYWQAMQGALREPIGTRVMLDKNPELTALLPLVARVFPEMKIVFALRDPRDVVLSCFLQRLPLNAVSVHYLTLERTAQKYAATMKAWLKIREMIQNPWLEVRYEDVVRDLERPSRRVLAFLDLPWDERVLQFHQRAQRKHVHSPTYEAVTKPVYSSSVGRWRNYLAQLEPHLSLLRPYIDAFGYNRA